MCKLLMIAGLTEDKQAAAYRFMLAALPGLTKDDKDGVGYAASAIGSGDLFGERWLKPAAAFKRRSPLSERDIAAQEAFGLAVEVEESYNAFGDITRPFSSIVLHTRMATCGVNLANVHPFVSEDTALAHNGVISNPEKFKRHLSTCDSEAILSSYLECGVDQVSDSIQETAGALEGYYACGVLARDRDEERILDIFKSDGASLCVAWVKQLNTWVFCTRPEILPLLSARE
jgi:hypothetical protein